MNSNTNEWPNEIKERKRGVVETSAMYPVDVIPWIDSLRIYQDDCAQSLCRICFEHLNEQQMLMMAKPNHYTLPHYQESRIIEYVFYQGSAELFLFDQNKEPVRYLVLREGDVIRLNTDFPRSMYVGENGAVFKEVFTGDFQDSYTHWPFGKSINDYPVNKLRTFFKGTI